MKIFSLLSRVYLPIGLIALMGSGLQAQIGISMDASKRSLSAEAVKEIRSLYFPHSSGYTEEPGSFLIVDIYLDQRGVRTLEGMDIRSTGEAKCRFRVYNQLSEREAVFSVTVPISGSSSSGTVETKVLRYFADRTTWCDSLTGVLDQVNPVGVDCNELAVQLFSVPSSDWHASLLRIYRFKNTFRSCADYSELLLEMELNKIDQKICDDVLYEATLLYDSGTNQNINRAVQKLLQLPPQSPCREKALSLSEMYAKNYRITRQNRTRLSHYRDVLLMNDTEAWLTMQLDQ